jgi:hypothetical protein
MTKIVYWNIQNFAINKIANPKVGIEKGTDNLTYAQSSASRYTLIKNTIEATIADIIVIVEVSSGAKGNGDLSSNNAGVQGAIRILTDLRAVAPNAQWRMVPPLKLSGNNTKETVAIFYRGVSGSGINQVNRYFTGPNTWTGGLGGLSSDALNPTATNYIGAPYDTFLTPTLPTPPTLPTRQIPPEAQYRANQWESQSAARIAFQSTTPSKPIKWLRFRRPFMACFFEEGPGTTKRNLTLFALHLDPKPKWASYTLNTLLTQVEDIMSDSDVSAKETKILCGDFNLNALTNAGADANIYAALNNYVPLLNPPATMGGGIDLATYEGYFATHLQLPTVDDNNVPIEDYRFLWSSNTTASFYPGYNYYDTADNNLYSIDNILVKPSSGTPNYQFTIMNPVVGTPFNLVAAPAGAPTGSITFSSQFTSPNIAITTSLNKKIKADWLQSPAYIYTQGNAIALISWGNYGRIISTSDHLALYASV